MRGLDSNVLLRFLTADDPHQSPISKRLILDAEERDEQLFISVVVLCEVVWVLKRSYQLTQDEILATLQRLLEHRLFVFEHRASVESAIDQVRQGGGDLADYLIGASNLRAGCRDTVTFDRALRATPGFTVLLD